MRTLTDYERGFIEAFIDADGSIVLTGGSKHANPNVRISFSNNNIDILNKIQRILGTDYKLTPMKRSKNYQFNLSSSRSYELLKQLRLVVKEHRRIVALELYPIVKGRQHKNQHQDLSDSQIEIDRLIEKFYN